MLFLILLYIFLLPPFFPTPFLAVFTTSQQRKRTSSFHDFPPFLLFHFLLASLLPTRTNASPSFDQSPKRTQQPPTTHPSTMCCCQIPKQQHFGGQCFHIRVRHVRWHQKQYTFLSQDQFGYTIIPFFVSRVGESHQEEKALLLLSLFLFLLHLSTFSTSASSTHPPFPFTTVHVKKKKLRLGVGK